MTKYLNKLPPTKRARPVDIHVGARVRLKRQMLGMSQTELGDAVGITFQQIQKYEKGSNRIGSSRLQQLADTLDVPVSYFFEGLPGNGSGRKKDERDEAFTAFLTDPDGVRFIRGWLTLGEADRKLAVRLVRAVMDTQ
jgi:transcriptional regulator with XRE-family HTH domain